MTTTTTLATALIAVSILDIIGVLLFIRQRNTIKEQRGILTAANIAAEKRTGIIAELRAQNKDLRESNLRLLNDANQMRQRLPGLADEPKPTLREERLGRRFPTLPEYTYEATYGPVPEAGKDDETR